ncbi:MAG: hypothetical protein NTU53_12100 [Planctomycetota bacterium]|nr:hypothetical protein [Planctomycetota bacterium]
MSTSTVSTGLENEAGGNGPADDDGGDADLAEWQERVLAGGEGKCEP